MSIKQICYLYLSINFILILSCLAFFDVKAALVISLIISTSFILIVATHIPKSRLQKNQLATLDINSGNKDREKSLLDYEREIKNHLFLLRYEEAKEGINERTNVKEYRPRVIQSIMTTSIFLEKSDLSIIVKGPFDQLKILSDILETPGSSFYVIKKGLN